MSDINCPYCDHELEICHDDGFGYEEGILHEDQCGSCGKAFTFTTDISFYYEPYKADCLNGSEHKLKVSSTIPAWHTKIICEDCELRRDPTPEEKIKYNIPDYKETK